MSKINSKSLMSIGFKRYHDKKNKSYYHMKSVKNTDVMGLTYEIAISVANYQNKWWFAINHKQKGGDWYSVDLLNNGPKDIDEVKQLADIILREKK